MCIGMLVPEETKFGWSWGNFELPTYVLGAELRSSGQAGCALNHCGFFVCLFLCFCFCLEILSRVVETGLEPMWLRITELLVLLPLLPKLQKLQTLPLHLVLVMYIFFFF